MAGFQKSSLTIKFKINATDDTGFVTAICDAASCPARVIRYRPIQRQCPNDVRS